MRLVGCTSVNPGCQTMRPEERDRMNVLCKLIQEEHDPKMFGELVTELDELLAVRFLYADLRKP